MRKVPLIVIFTAILVGIPVGLGGFTFYYADGLSYMSNDPKACINCHIMIPQYQSWHKSSHHNVATCNDCHTPGNIMQKYYGKAVNGYWHSWAFTTGRFKEPIEMHEPNRQRVEMSCRGCHAQFLQSSNLAQHQDRDIQCTRCHSQVGHNR
jgi:cytochrome c nitrite reductase small subunit